MQKKALRISSGALLFQADDALINFYKVRIARADHAFRVYKTVHVNCHTAAVHEHEVRVADQAEMVRPKALDKELFWMPPKTKHFAMTRPEFLLANGRRLIRASHVRLVRTFDVGLVRARTYVSLARGRACPRLILLYLRGAALDVCACLRFCLRFGLLLLGTHLLPFRRRCGLRFVRLPLRRLLWLRLA